MKRVEDLVRDVCGAPGHPLADALRGRAAASKGFLGFAETHASKLRKKVRTAFTDEERSDLLAELDVAALMLRDPRFAVTYEPFHAPGRRGPDFRVVYKGHTALHVEVTRPRLQDADSSQAASKVARVLTDKVEQFPAGATNLLVLVVPDRSNTPDLVPDAVRLLERASGDASLAARLGNVGAYARHRGRLGAVLSWSGLPDGTPSLVRAWLEPRTKHPLPPDVLKVFVRGA